MISLLAALCTAHAGVLPDPDGPIPPAYTADADGRYHAMLRAGGLEPHEVRALRDLGLTLGGRRGATPLGGFWPVRGTLADLRRARALGWDLDIARRLDLAPPPLHVTSVEVQATDLWSTGASPLDGPTGAGMTILDIDSGIDLFHPQFFRADAGHHAFVDVDDDGKLSLDRDGIDLDGDGAIRDSEVLRRATAWVWRFDYDLYEWVQDEKGPFNPARDWVWLDTNGNGVRDVGSAGGFGVDTPGFGEPIFVPDDADGDGVIRSPERLIQLGSSVVAAAQDSEGKIYKRDVNLVKFADVFADNDGLRSHGTGVAGILAGGQLPHQRQTRGLAPDADLLIATSSYDEFVLADALTWAEELGVDAVIHEYAPWSDFALDGSSAVEQMVDEQQQRGITHVCPAGNLADAGKHTVATPRDGVITARASIPDTGYRALILDVHGEAGNALPSSCSLNGPYGPMPVTLDERGKTAADDLFTWGSATVTGRDRPWAHLVVWRNTRDFDPGEYTLTCAVQDDASWHIFLDDYSSGWGRGIVFEDEVRANTMGVPSTSDRCISVGAYAGRNADFDVDVGELRTWSSRGPTVDGRRTIDLLGPDDPASASPTYPFEDYEAPYSGFGGTSGASPHVAALAALMMQIDPSLTGDDVRDMVREGTEPTAGDEDDVGQGKVRGYQAMFGTAPPTPPAMATDVALSLQPVYQGATCRVVLTASSAEHPSLLVQVDLDYDGTVDVPYGENTNLTPLLDDEPTLARVELAVDGFRVGGLATTLDLSDSPCTSALASNEAESSKAGCGCASSAPMAGWLLLLAPLALIRRR